jgi:hypothetical protein
VLDWGADAMQKYIHQANVDDRLHQGDTPYTRNISEGGAAYAPYQVAVEVGPGGDEIILYYVLSTWNPYQAVLMKHAILREDFSELG